MTLTKKHYYWIGGIVVLLIILWYFFVKKKPAAESSYDPNLLILGSESGFINCRPGTCAGKHTDGTWWCSSAYCGAKKVTEASTAGKFGPGDSSYPHGATLTGIRK